MKTTMKILAIGIMVIALASCEKEELFEPVQRVEEVDKPVKASAKANIAPKLSLQIRLRTHNAAYEELRNHRTVQFNGKLYSITSEIIAGGAIRNKLWSSMDGRDWSLNSTHPFPIGPSEMVVLNGKMLVIGTLGTSGQYQVYSSDDGKSWNLEAPSAPFSILTSSGAVVFNNKVYVFAWGDYGDTNQDVYSSPDGINWTLENDDAFPVRLGGTPIVFKDVMYYMGGLNNGSEEQSTIFQTTNGRDWSLVTGATPNILRPTEDFPAKYGHAAVVHDNKVWIFGGGTTSSEADRNKDFWYSGDMKNWTKYNGRVSVRAVRRATLLSHNNKMLLLGGFYYVGSGGAASSVASKYVWSIKPKREGWIPVDIPGPTIPRY